MLPHMIRCIFLCIFSLFSFKVFSQSYSIQGTVSDSISNEPLGFVTIVFNDGTNGTVTNAFGEYSYTSKTSIYKLTCSYIGYNKKEIIIRPSSTNTVNIKLVPNQYNLSNVVIISGDNPANRIVRAVVNQRSENDPDRFNSYSYTAYNKFIYSGVPPSERTKKDSARSGLYEFLEQHYFMILESVVETHFLRPDKKENIVATKISGVSNPSFTLMNTQIQPLSFYGNFITLLEKNYINPFTKGSTERYFFNIEDTLYAGPDTIYRLSFRPWKGRNFDGLKGIAEISSDGYAIRYIQAEPSDTISSLMRIRIEQFAAKEGDTWFPNRFVSEVRFDNMLNNGMQVIMHGVTSLRDIQIEPQIEKKILSGIQVDIDPLAAYRDESFWNTYRADSLTGQEVKTYRVLDSLGKKRGFDAKLKFVEALLDGELRYKYFNFNISRFLWQNTLEHYRPGIGLRTNERVFKHIYLGGFAGYGIRDKRWKYGGDIRFRLFRPNDVFLKAFYWNDLEESGAVTFYKDVDLITTEILRGFLVNTFDRVERYQIDFSGRTFQYLHYNISLYSAKKYTTTTYQFIQYRNDEPLASTNFQFTALRLQMRYAYKEKMMRSLNTTFFIYTPYPTFFLNVTYGIPNILGSEFSFTKIEGKMKSTLKTKSLGDFYVQLAAGYIHGTVPLSDLFAGRGNYQPVGLYSENSFQTMRLNEFYSDKYVAAFIQHDLKTLLLRGKKFQPKPLFVFNMALGTLRNPDQHTNFLFTVPSRGYYETGLIVYDIITKEYLGVARFGLGGGAFYRLGYYSFNQPYKNIAIKAQLTLGF